MTDKLYGFTFKDTGVHVQVRKVSPLLVVELQKAFPPPTPPKQRVEIGGEWVEESNASHPDFIAAKERYNLELTKLVRRLVIRRGVIIPPENKTWQEEVKQLRADWLEEYGKELEGDDKDLYISYIAVGTDSDFEELLNAILQRSQPTETEVAAARESFPG